MSGPGPRGRRRARIAVLFGLAAFAVLTIALPGATGTDAQFRTVELTGTLTNTTVEAEAPARLVLAVRGETVTATLTTEPPLVGSGKLEGRIRGGWCELAGRLEQGFQIQLRGVMNSRDLRGTYLAAVDGSPLQYGKFHLTVAPAR